MSHIKHRSGRSKLGSLFIWHRYIGVVAALFVIVLSVTGLLLNHTDTLQLDARHVNNHRLLDWYSINVPEPISYRAGSHWVTQLGERIYFNDRELGTDAHHLIGMVVFNNYLVIAIDNYLLLVTMDGELIEKLDGASGVPAGMRRLGITAGKIAIQAAHGVYVTNPDRLSWREYDTLEAQWSQTQTPPIELNTALSQHYRGSGLPLERVILDIHSGRIAGQAGVLLMDAAAILFMFLAVSGIWLWVKCTRNTRKHQLARIRREPKS